MGASTASSHRTGFGRYAYARLMVDFGFSFEAPYTVIELYEPPGDEAYTYAAVTTSEASILDLVENPTDAGSACTRPCWTRSRNGVATPPD